MTLLTKQRTERMKIKLLQDLFFLVKAFKGDFNNYERSNKNIFKGSF